MTVWLARRLRRDWRGDDGAFTLMVITFAAALFLMVGLAVDGGGRLTALATADDIAAEAARAAGQAIDLPQAINGTADIVHQDGSPGGRAGLSPRCRRHRHAQVIDGGHAVKVTVQVVYSPKLLGAIDLGPWTETGVATAQLLTG